MEVHAKPEQRLLDYGAAAAYLGLSESTVRKKVSRREMPYRKVGRCVRFSPADLEAYLDRCAMPAEMPE